MCDPVFAVCHSIASLLQVVKGNVLALTLQTYGCRVIQKALEVIDEEDQTMVACMTDCVRPNQEPNPT